MSKRRLQVEVLDTRYLLTTFIWDPLVNNGVNWNQPDNWRWVDGDGKIYRSTAQGSPPGPGDTALFGDTHAAARIDDCLTTTPVTVRTVVIGSAYSKALVLGSSLTITGPSTEIGGTFRFESSTATVAGYLPSRGMSPSRGALFISGGST